MKIAVPSPCHVPWQNMQPTQRGAFCEVCSKEVVDFTRMTDDEVKNYFLNENNRATCGRFRANQLTKIAVEIPLTILQQRIPGWKKFLAIVMIGFGTLLFGCEINTGKALAITEQHTKGEPAIDTVENYESIFAGGITIVDDSLEEKTLTCERTMGFTIPTVLVGDTIVIPDGLIEASIDTNKLNQRIPAPEKVDTLKAKQKIPADSSACRDDIIYSK